MGNPIIVSIKSYAIGPEIARIAAFRESKGETIKVNASVEQKAAVIELPLPAMISDQSQIVLKWVKKIS